MMPYGPIHDAHSTTILYLAKFMFSSYGSKYCWPIKLQDFLKCSISRKKWMRKFVFDMQINIEVFYKLIVKFRSFLQVDSKSEIWRRILPCMGLPRALTWTCSIIKLFWKFLRNSQMSPAMEFYFSKKDLCRCFSVTSL